jgi:4-hydroxybenzoate polyprenyltransferase
VDSITNPSTSNGVLESVRALAADIKLAHSVFALPFAILGAFMAVPSDPIKDVSLLRFDADLRWQFLGQLGLVILAMVFARTVAMLANRVLDARLDAANPRTAGRALPSGRASLRSAVLAIIICSALFMGVCVLFGVLWDNWWPAILGLPVLAWISAYGFFKRFTWMCHVYLGSSLALSPIAAAIAINPNAIVPWHPVFQPTLWLLSGMVLLWVAGFDVVYALQDVDVDRDAGLHSMPSRLGVRRAMWISRVMHGLAVGCLMGVWLLSPQLKWLFAGGVVLTAGLLLYEHLTVHRWGTTKMALTFFTLNGVISCVLGGLGVADLLIA